jgi:hypothetical protein
MRFLTISFLTLMLSGCAVVTGILEGLGEATREPRFAWVESNGKNDGFKTLKVAALQPEDPAGIEPPKAFIFAPELDSLGPAQGFTNLFINDDGTRLAGTLQTVGLGVESGIRIYDIDDGALIDSFNLLGEARAISARCTRNQAFLSRLPRQIPRDAQRTTVIVSGGGFMSVIGWDGLSSIGVEVRTRVDLVFDSPSQGMITYRVPGQTTFSVDYSIGPSGASLVECFERSSGPANTPGIVTLEQFGSRKLILRNGQSVENALRSGELVAPRGASVLGAQPEI